MKSVYLVQRLNAPVNYDNPFVFGGGRINGGINKEAMNTIRKIWSFDYMGSAKFEWGAVPKALDSMLKADLDTSRAVLETKIIYIIAPRAIIADIVEWVANAAKGIHGHLKERLGLQRALNGKKYADTKGWLKIEEDNYCHEPFMFFIDENMFNATCETFGVKQLA